MFCAAHTQHAGFDQSADVARFGPAIDAADGRSCGIKAGDCRARGIHHRAVSVHRDTAHGIGDAGAERYGVERRLCDGMCLISIAKRGGKLIRGARARELKMQDGRCVGVRADVAGTAIDFDAAAVVIADGGFQGNPDLVGQYISPAP